MTDEEGVDGHQLSGMASLDMAFAELGAERFQETDLLVGEFDPVLGRGLLQSEQTLLPGQHLWRD